MKRYNLILVTMMLILFAYAGSKGKKVAIVKIQKGVVHSINAVGEKVLLKKGSWVEQGAVVKTQPKSFIKLSFIDKSTVNIGPDSEMKIEKFSKNEAGVLNVISGKIRSQVSKNYLEMDKNKSKLFVKSKSAVMGIRGTDFIFSTNKKTGASTAILFEGSVVFNKLSKNDRKLDLESVVNKGYRINPGQFSVSRLNLKRPTVPSKLSSKQFIALEKNKNFAKVKVDVKAPQRKSVVPPGLTGDIVAPEGVGLRSIASSEKPKIDIKSTKGFKRGDEIKPTDGSIVHVDSGTIIPVAKDALFDKNTKEWSSQKSGSVSDSGDYIPPKSYSIDNEGKIYKEVGKNKIEVDTSIVPVGKSNAFEGQKGGSKKELKGKAPASIEDSFKSDEESKEEDPSLIRRAPVPPGEPGWLPENINKSRPRFIDRFRAPPPASGRTRVNGTVNR